MSTCSPYLRLLAVAICLNNLSLISSFSFTGSPLRPRILSESSIASTVLNTLHFQSTSRPRHRITSCSLSADDTNDEIARQIAKAKELLEKSKAKMEKKQKEKAAEEAAKDDDSDEDDVAMFFASKSSTTTDNDKKRERVVKTKNEDSGLITTDGDLMAELSESEEWEARPLSQVFKSELKNSDDASRKKFERDIAQSMWNLKKTMKKEDYEAIFDKRNFFIGEEN